MEVLTKHKQIIPKTDQLQLDFFLDKPLQDNRCYNKYVKFKIAVLHGSCLWKQLEKHHYIIKAGLQLIWMKQSLSHCLHSVSFPGGW